MIIPTYLPYVNNGQDVKHVGCGEWSEKQQMKLEASPVPRIVRHRLPATIILSLALPLAACAPSPQKVVMPEPSNTSQNPSANDPDRPAFETVPPVNVAKPADAGAVTDTSAEAAGRRTLSTAFVMVGADGHLTVELLDGRLIVLREVIMGPKDYCGVQISGNSARTKYCGGYAEVAAARPGGGEQPDSEISNAGEPKRGARY